MRRLIAVLLLLPLFLAVPAPRARAAMHAYGAQPRPADSGAPHF